MPWRQSAAGRRSPWESCLQVTLWHWWHLLACTLGPLEAVSADSTSCGARTPINLWNRTDTTIKHIHTLWQLLACTLGPLEAVSADSASYGARTPINLWNRTDTTIKHIHTLWQLLACTYGSWVSADPASYGDLTPINMWNRIITFKNSGIF